LYFREKCKNYKMKDNYCILMAGGIGSRFWPMSTEEFPKQFHDVLGMGKTLLQMSFDRMLLVCPKENIYIVTNSDYKELVQAQLPGIDENQILLEPSRKNTAPCVAYASYKIKKMNPNATLVVAPSDHIVMNEVAFKETLEIALSKANSEDCLVTLGIKPSRPDTGYGYIQFLDNVEGTIDVVRDVKMFTEKPNLELAKEFIDSGDFYWNAGIFVWTVDSIIKSFEEHLLSDFGWSDLGTWGALYGHIDKDENNNAVIGDKTNLYDSKNCIVRLPKDKLAVIQGLDDYIVVEEKGVLLICKKEEEQRIKEFVTDLKQKR